MAQNSGIGKTLREWAVDWVCAQGPFRNQAEQIVNRVMARRDCAALSESWMLAAMRLNSQDQMALQRVLADEAIAFWALSAHMPYWVRDFASLGARLRKIPIQFFVSDTVHAEMAEVKAV